MNSENKSSGAKPDARQPPKGRNSAKPQAANSSDAPAERPQRRRENNEQRDGGERRERPNRSERGDRPERGERPERPDRPRRPQGGQAAGTNADKTKPAAEEKAHGPVVYVKGNIAAGSTWAKNANGPSFADMVRQNAGGAAEKTSAKSTPPPAKQSPPAAQQQQAQAPAKQPEPAQPAQPQQEQPQPAQPQPQQPPQQAAPPPAPQTPPVQQPPQQPEESSEEEEVVVITAAQAPPVVVMEAIPEPPVPVQTVVAPHYVLEIERVVSVKLPSRVTQTAEAQRGAYMFSAQAGKPPTPPPTVQQHALYRPDTANLGARQWSLGTDSRIQQPAPQQQQGWPGAGQMDYWNNSGERAPASRPFMGSQSQAPYNSYPSTVPLSHQRPASNAFPMRFRSSEVPESVLRQQPSAPFNRASQTTNGGGVW